MLSSTAYLRPTSLPCPTAYARRSSFIDCVSAQCGSLPTCMPASLPACYSLSACPAALPSCYCLPATACLPACLPACLLLPTCDSLPACLPTYYCLSVCPVSAFLSAYLPACLPTYLPACYCLPACPAARPSCSGVPLHCHLPLIFTKPHCHLTLLLNPTATYLYY